MLSQLLPYNPAKKKKTQVIQSLKEYRALLRALKAAIFDLHADNFEKFDALVGENGCHIRAVWLAMYSAGCKASMIQLVDKIEASIAKIDQKLASNKLFTCSFQTLLEKDELEIILRDEEIMFLNAYLLTEVKYTKEQPFVLIGQQGTDVKKLKKFGDISFCFADKLVTKLRTRLADASIEFIRKAASDLKDSWLKHMVSDTFTIKHNGLSCIPLFWTCKALYFAAERAAIPLVVHVRFIRHNQIVDEHRLLFTPNQTGSYCLTNILPQSMSPAWIIQGVTLTDMTKEEWTHHFTKWPIRDVFLAAAADHRCYPNNTSVTDTEREWYRALALSAGFSSQNPTTFFIQHVHASTTIIKEYL